MVKVYIQIIRGAYAFGPVRGTRRVLYGARMLLRLLLPSQRVPEDVLARRMIACRACPLFHTPLQTCGRPGHKDEDGEPWGCQCWMPAAWRLRSKRCFRYEELGEPDPWEENP